MIEKVKNILDYKIKRDKAKISALNGLLDKNECSPREKQEYLKISASLVAYEDVYDVLLGLKDSE